MTIRLPSSFVLAAAAAVAAPAFLTAQSTAAAAAARPLAALLPAGSTYAVLEFAGVAACRSAARELPLAAIASHFLAAVPEAARREHLDDEIERLGRRAEQGLQRMGIDAGDLHQLLARPMALAVGRLTLNGLGPSLALVVDEGDAAPAIDRLCDALQTQLTRRHDVAGEDVDVAGVAAHLLHIDRGPQLLTARVGGCFVLTNSRGYLGEIAAVAGGRQPSLATATAYGNAAAGLPSRPLASLFVDPSPLTAALRPLLPYEAGAIGEALGVDDLRGLFAACGAGADGDHEVAELSLTGDRTGLVKALFAKPVAFDFAARCPADTIAFGAFGCDFDAAATAVERVLAQVPDGFGERARRGFAEGWRHVLRQLEASPHDAAELHAALGGQVSFALGFGDGPMPKPELMVHVAVRDAASAAQILSHVEELGRSEGANWGTRQVGDATIRYAKLDRGQAIVTPCYVQVPGGVVLASNVAALVTMLGQDREPAGSLAAQDDFRAAVAMAQGSVGFVHARWFRAVERSRQLLETQLYNLVDSHADELGFDRDALPDVETLAKAVGSSTSVLRVDDAGIRFVQHGPVGLGALVAGGGLFLDELLRRSAARIY